MADVLVIFGSASDSPIFEKILSALKAKGISFEMRICSAHRTPEMLSEIISKTSAKVIIAGAGLSAALPGVVASHTVKPVIGVPCAGNYDGLDALLSVHQMPPGIPILGVGVNAAEQAAAAAEKILKGNKSVAIVKRGSVEEIEKRAAAAKELLQKFSVAFEENGEAREGAINLEFFEMNETAAVSEEGKLVIFVPCAKQNPANLSLKLLELSKQGLWVGLGRGENAAIAAMEILGQEQLAKKMLDYRKEMKEKIFQADAEESKKWK